MRVLLVSNQRQNIQGIGNPIMYRMRDALMQDSRIENVVFEPFCNNLSSLRTIRRKAKGFDIVHIHFGGLYALIIWLTLIGVRAKKFITFHGTDIHAKALKTAKNYKEKFKIIINQKASFLSIILFNGCGFVAEEMTSYVPKFLQLHLSKKGFVQLLGVNYEEFPIIDKSAARKHLNLAKDKKLALFSDVSNTSIKRRDIAQSILDNLGSDYSLCIMCGVKPKEVPYYLNACDFLLLTSDEEGSPNIIREALALNKPVFSVNVGDVSKQLQGLKNSSIISRNPLEAAKQIKSKLELTYTDNSRDRLRKRLDFVELNRKVVDQYIRL